MVNHLRILMVEDSGDDADLTLLHLKDAGIDFDCVRVDDLEGFLAALAEGRWDLVISDFSLPGTDGMVILDHLRRADPDLPFLLLSGVLDEGAAVDAMRKGANDFVLKGHLSRLVPAIQREMKDLELRRKQRAFEEELRLLHTAIGQTPDMVLITDAEGLILYANAAAEAISGYPKSELQGQNPRLFKSGQHEAGFYRSMWEVLQRGETWKGHIVNKRRDGVLWNSEAVISPVFGKDGELKNYLCTARDITLERQLQEAVEQTQRLETIGTLTSGIAHDFNNILTPVIGHSELGLTREPGDPHLHHDLEVILASAMRARDLISQILAFSRKGNAEEIPIEVQSLLSESLKLLRATVPSSIAFKLDLNARGRFVRLDPTKLHQVILNLCTNAAYAMRGQAGKLAVSLEPSTLEETSCVMNVRLPAGEYLCLTVEDSGRGIQPEFLDKIFLPFFTTKSVREGTGLGLSVTHSIVSAAGGGIQVSSRPEEGTHFTVFLPLTTDFAAPSMAPQGAPLRGRGNLLLVDDEQMLLEMLESGLRRLGFQVDSYADPTRALAAFQACPSRYQAVVTDQTMPGLSGVQLAKGIWASAPECPVFLLSGDPEVDQVSESLRRMGSAICLHKPLGPQDLTRAILAAVPALAEFG